MAIRIRRLVAIIAIQGLIALAVCEIGLRLIAPHNALLTALLYQPTTVTRYEQLDSVEELLGTTSLGFRPGSEFAGFVLNSRSLRTKEYSDAKADGDYRVLAFGDSFTYASGGLPHKQHWPTLLEADLRSRLREPVEVLRLGVGATGTAFQLRLWQIEGRGLDADAVVLAFFVGNDFVDAAGDLGRAPERAVGDRISDVSYVVRLVRNTLRVSSEASRAGLAAQPAAAPTTRVTLGTENPAYAEGFDPDEPTLTRAAHLRIEQQRMAWMLRSRRPQFDALFERVAGTLLGFAAEVSTTGARFIVMIIPDEVQVDAELRARVLRAMGRSPADFDLTLPQRSLTTLFDDNAIEYVDLLPEFRQLGEHQRLYRLRDTHWNAGGNRLAAERLADFWTRGADSVP